MTRGGLLPLVDVNPLHWLGDAAKEGVADGFTAMMMSLWSAALWLLRAVFGLLDQFVTPRLDTPGLAHLYSIVVGLSVVVALMVAMGQLGITAIRQDGRRLATLVTGLAQYGAVLAVWVGVCAAVVLGCAGLSKILLTELIGVDSFSGYAAGTGWVDHVSGTVEAAVLGVCALFLLIPAALGYLVIMLAREGALLVLVATMPIAAAGALGEGTRAWMWKSIRWFLAASLTAPLLALVLGLGIQISQAAIPAGDQAANGSVAAYASDTSVPSVAGPASGSDVTSGAGDQVPDTAANIGMAVVGCVITLIGCFCPMALFRLLAFVDPGTGSGASFRSAVAANGGVAGLLSRRTQGSSSPTSAQVVDGNGQSAGESSAEAETSARYSQKLAGLVPAVGKAAGGVLSTAVNIAGQGAALGVDVMGQSGVGHQGYYDTTVRSSGSRPVNARNGRPHLPDSPRDDDHEDRPQSAVPDVGAPRLSGAAPGEAGAGADAALLA